MRRTIVALLCTTALYVVPSSATADPIRGIEVLAPGPADGGDIVLRILNNDALAITSASFYTAGAESQVEGAPLTFGGIFNEVNGTAGFAALTFTEELSWSYEFSDFGKGQFFQFNWDPDIEGDQGYGGVVREQLGLVVGITTVRGTFFGVLGPGGPNGGLRTVIETPAPVPEPSTLLLFGTAIAGTAVRGWRRRRRHEARTITTN